MTEASILPATTFRPLPSDRLERVEGWGMADWSMGYVFRPSTVSRVRSVLQLAAETGRSLVPRGNGYGYGDVALNRENIVLDLTRMNRILDWNPETGIAKVEAGVSIGQLWRHTIEDGWWPTVVPGTQHPTVGGCASTNVHGKNQFNAGSFGEHILSADLLLPSGEVRVISPTQDSDLFRAAVGGIGMFGIFLSLTLQLKRVESGFLRVEEAAPQSLDDSFAFYEERKGDADYMVGWIDGFSAGRALGRGLVHAAWYSDQPGGRNSLRRHHQELSPTMFGVISRSSLWMGMKPFVNNPGWKMINEVRYRLGALHDGRFTYWPHARFQFFHDYLPDWKRSWKPGGDVQYQVFVPEETARDVVATLLRETQRHRLFAYLCVLKRHRRDDFLLQYLPDGYGFSMDFRETGGVRRRLRALLSCLTRDVVVPAGGKFYLAKDNSLDSESFVRSMGEGTIERFLRLKSEVDPCTVLQSDMYRRLFAPYDSKGRPQA